MAIICRDRKLLFIMVPGTGCSAIGSVLIKKLGGEWLPREPLFRGSRKLLNNKHNTIAQLLHFGVLSKAEVDKFVKFATIRNPYDRYASTYERLVGTWTENAMDSTKPNGWNNIGDEAFQQKLRARKLAESEGARRDGFGKWLEQVLVRSHRADWRIIRRVQSLIGKGTVHRYPAFPMIEGVDELIRYERLEEDFNRILRIAGVEEFVPVPHQNPTPGKKPYPDYYTPELRKLMEWYAGEQMAKFDYSFEQKVVST